MSGKIIFVNGPSSSGKSTLCRALQSKLEEPFWHFSIDHLNAARVLPIQRIKAKEFSWQAMRPAFFDGFHRCLPALVGSGNNLIVEHIIESEDWMKLLAQLFQPFDVFSVGVVCPLHELERREKERGDRHIGEARRDFEQFQQYMVYDMQVDSTLTVVENTNRVISSWKKRQSPTAFNQLEARSS